MNFATKHLAGLKKNRTSNIGIDIAGDEEVMKAFKDMPKDVVGKVLRNATGKAMMPYAKQARANMRIISPTIAKAIGTRTKLYAHRGVVINVVGVKRDTKATITKKEITMPDGTTRTVTRKHDPRNTAHLVEFGTKAHKIRVPWLDSKLLGVRIKYWAQHPGTAEYKPMRRALESKRNEVVSILRNDVIKGVEILAEKAANKAARAARKAGSTEFPGVPI